MQDIGLAGPRQGVKRPIHNPPGLGDAAIGPGRQSNVRSTPKHTRMATMRTLCRDLFPPGAAPASLRKSPCYSDAELQRGSPRRCAG
jgi:hypothetical protein